MAPITPPRSATAHVHVAVGGMDCAEEAALVRRALAGHDGVGPLEFDLIGGRVTVAFDPGRTTAAAILSAIAGTGLKAGIDESALPSGDDRESRASAPPLSPSPGAPASRDDRK